ncbi:MAG: DUF368 domain-containing protein [Erysipelotrichaceae bacterium]
MFIINFIRGFTMALADSVPGVSGGTIAFLFGFYDQFVGSIDDIFHGNKETRKAGLTFIIKLGLGWIIGMGLAVSVLANIFDTQIYKISSLFIGFIACSIPVIVMEEKACLKNYKQIYFVIIGAIIVMAITYFNPVSSSGNSFAASDLTIGFAIYVFVAAMLAISAMVLPGISGSTILLVFGLYVPVITALKDFLHFQFDALPILIIFGFGIIAGVLVVIRLIRNALENYRSQMVYLIIGMMIGSFYAIIMGPTTLKVPQAAISFSTFHIVFFLIGAAIVIALQLSKGHMSREK